jgi:hypothetical protein
MLCDVISAVTEFMVRVLHPRSGIVIIPDVVGIEACDVISVVAESMVDVVGIEALACV